MHNRARLVPLENLANPLLVRDVANFERTKFYRLAVPARQIVISNRDVAMFGQRLARMAADKTCAAGNKDFQ